MSINVTIHWRGYTIMFRVSKDKKDNRHPAR